LAVAAGSALTIVYAVFWWMVLPSDMIAKKLKRGVAAGVVLVLALPVLPRGGRTRCVGGWFVDMHCVEIHTK